MASHSEGQRSTDDWDGLLHLSHLDIGKAHASELLGQGQRLRRLAMHQTNASRFADGCTQQCLEVVLIGMTGETVHVNNFDPLVPGSSVEADSWFLLK